MSMASGRLGIQLFALIFVAICGSACAQTWTNVGAPGHESSIQTCLIRTGLTNVYVARMDRNDSTAIIESSLAGGVVTGAKETVETQAERYDDAINYWDSSWSKRNMVAVAVNGQMHDEDTGITDSGTIHSGWYAKRYVPAEFPDSTPSSSGFAWKLDRSCFIGGCVSHTASKQIVTYQSGQTQLFQGINRTRGADELIIYTPQQYYTPYNGSCYEVVVRMQSPMLLKPTPAKVNGTVIWAGSSNGARSIEFDCIVLSASGSAISQLQSQATVGTTVGISQEITNQPPETCGANYEGQSGVDWTNTYASVGGGVMLVRDGQNSAPTDLPSLVPTARTAVAYNNSYVYFVVAERAGWSFGINLPALGDFLVQQLGAQWAINMDGGASTTMWATGSLLNQPEEGSYALVPNGLMMVNVVDAPAKSTRFTTGQSVTTNQVADPYQGPGDNFCSSMCLNLGVTGTIVSHPMNGTYAKGCNWWYCAFGGIRGWVSESALNASGGGPTVTGPTPASGSACIGGSCSFGVTASGSGTITYQWQKNGVNLANGGHYSGVTTATMTISSADYTTAANYRCRVTDVNGTNYSASASFSVVSSTVISVSPAAQTVNIGDTAQFGVSAQGSNLTYRWQKNGSNIYDGSKYYGAATPNLQVANCQDPGDEGSYRCVVSGSCGSATSASAVLTVNAAPALTVKLWDDFDSYTSQAHFQCAWEPYQNSGLVLSDEQYSSQPWCVKDGGSGNKSSRYFGDNIGTDTQCLVWDVKFFDTMSSQRRWVELQDDYGGMINQIIAMGTCDYYWIPAGANGHDASNSYVGRVMVQADPRPSWVSGDGWFVFDESSQAFRSYGWHTLHAQVYQNEMHFWVDGNYAKSWVPYPYGTFNRAVIGSGEMYQGDGYFDDFTLIGGDGFYSATIIEQQPQAGNVCPGGSRTLNCWASGTSLAYQWYCDAVGALTDGNGYYGVNTPNLTISNMDSSKEGYYYCRVNGATGEAETIWVTVWLASATSVISQPSPQTVYVGQTVQFTCNGDGEQPLSYQWCKNGSAIAGATSPTYQIASAATTDAGNYFCVVNGGCGTATSNTVPLIVDSAVTITFHPQSVSVCPGASTSFSVAATGSSLTYQWRKGTVNITNGGHYSGATTATLLVSNVDATDVATNYNCVVTGTWGTAISNNAALTLRAVTAITTQPTNKSVCPGGTTTFSVAATGYGTLTYQWQKNGANLVNGGHYSGVTTATLTVSSASTEDAASYRCVVTGGCGSATSNSAALALYTTTAITTQPVNATVSTGGTATFSVVAAGSSLTYQWQKNSVNLTNGGHYSGVNSATLTISDCTSTEVGNYRCIATGSCGSVTSIEVSLALMTGLTIIVDIPDTRTTGAGCPVTLHISATGTGTLTYQWQKAGGKPGLWTSLKDGPIYTGAKTNTLFFYATGGTYRCAVSDLVESIYSNECVVTAKPNAPCDE